jgi:hypothetical protein
VRSGGLLQIARRYARMTREDVLELTAVFLQVATRQVRDARTSIARRLR